MTEFLLKKKWIGALFVVIYSLIAASFVAKIATQLMNEYAPVVANEIADFLPITVENGAIVAPENTLIQKSYGEGWQAANVVLDTRVDRFEPTSLQGQGLYVSREFIYTVARNEIKIHSLKEMPDGTFDKETLDAAVEYIEKNIGKWSFPIMFVTILLQTMFAILIYTLLLHWLIAIVFKVKFGHTLRVNTLAYVTLSIVVLLAGFSVGFLMSLLIMVAANFGINFVLKE